MAGAAGWQILKEDTGVQQYCMCNECSQHGLGVEASRHQCMYAPLSMQASGKVGFEAQSGWKLRSVMEMTSLQHA